MTIEEAKRIGPALAAKFATFVKLEDVTQRNEVPQPKRPKIPKSQTKAYLRRKWRKSEAKKKVMRAQIRAAKGLPPHPRRMKKKRYVTVRKQCKCGQPAIKVSQHEGVCAFCAGTEKRGVGRKFHDIQTVVSRRWVV